MGVRDGCVDPNDNTAFIAEGEGEGGGAVDGV